MIASTKTCIADCRTIKTSNENADFSPKIIKNSIKEGEKKTIQALKGQQDQW